MSRKVDRSICRYCRQKSPAVEILVIKGVLQGECRQCKRNRLANKARKDNYAKGLYQNLPQFVAVNLKTLGTLQPGSYRLLEFADQSEAGYITITKGLIYLSHWTERHVFRKRLFDVASWLGNLGLFLDSKPYSPPEALETAFAGLQPAEVGDRLIWFDKGLEARAVAVLRDEIAAAKRANVAAARAAKAVQKTPSESD